LFLAQTRFAIGTTSVLFMLYHLFKAYLEVKNGKPTSGGNVQKLFFFVADAAENKLERLPMERKFTLV